MGDHYKTCELHGKPFPNNLIDTTKTEMLRVYVEKKEDIEGQSVKLTLFAGDKTEEEGLDVCSQCMQERLLSLLSGNGTTPTWKGVTWSPTTKTKKDGTTYERNEKTIMRVPEIAEKIRQEKKAPTPQKA